MVQRILAVDYGKARHGLAVSDELGMMAHALRTVQAQPEQPGLEAIAAAAREKNVSLVLVGMPRNMDGSYGAAAEYVRAFCKKLEPLLPCPLKTWDERLTTVQAQRSLHDAGRNTKDSRAVIDQVAAQMILQNYLDAESMKANLFTNVGDDDDNYLGEDDEDGAYEMEEDEELGAEDEDAQGSEAAGEEGDEGYGDDEGKNDKDGADGENYR